MFVTQSSYRRLERDLTTAIAHLEAYKREYRRVTGQWNDLVDRVNAKGGEDFLTHGSLNPTSQFNKEDVNRLIRLCHPDKHNNSDVSNEITKKLLAMKERMK